MSKEEDSTVEANQPEEAKEPTTSQALFGEDYLDSKPHGGLKGVAEEDTTKEEPEAVEAEPEAEEPTTEDEAKETEYLELEEFGDRMFKLNVGGKEETISVKDAIRRMQTDKYLTQKGQELAEQHRQLEKAKDGLIGQPVAEVKASQDEWDSPTYEEPTESDAKVAKLEKQVAELTGAIGSMSQTLAPSVYDQNVRAVDAHLKGEGFSDFMDFKDEIEIAFSSLSVEEQGMLGMGDMVSKYKDLKIQKLSNSAQEKSIAPAEDRKQPNIVQVIGGSGTPSNADADDAKYAKEFERAQETGNWQKVFQLKGVL